MGDGAVRTTAVTCDRCKQSIVEGGTVIEATAGALRRRRGPISLDLCSGCVDSFLAWLDDTAAKAPEGEP